MEEKKSHKLFHRYANGLKMHEPSQYEEEMTKSIIEKAGLEHGTIAVASVRKNYTLIFETENQMYLIDFVHAVIAEFEEYEVWLYHVETIESDPVFYTNLKLSDYDESDDKFKDIKKVETLIPIFVDEIKSLKPHRLSFLLGEKKITNVF